MLLRDHGRLWFATLRDWSGDVQVLLDGAVLGDWKTIVDLGDHIGVTGEVITSRRGAVTVRATAWTLTAKCLHPLPDKHRGLADPEALVRQRHLDLIVNPAARDMLRIRSAAVNALRGVLLGRDFIEVETPILQRVHGGANARPFTTHSNAFDMRLYLRIAPELYLKRLAVGGVERVFELGRDFRNEGVDATHNPEFTMLEAYEAYGDYVSMRALARELVLAAAIAAHGKPVAWRGGDEIDLSGEWPVVDVHKAISSALGATVDPGTSLGRLRELAATAGVPVQPGWAAGAVVLELYERLVEARTGAPTFYTDFPTEVSPLARGHRGDPRLAERWDLVAFGTEIGTAYTELIDPVEQRRRLTAQSLLAAGDGTRRGVPGGARVRDAADRGTRPRRRPLDHVVDRPSYPGDRTVPADAPAADVIGSDPRPSRPPAASPAGRRRMGRATSRTRIRIRYQLSIRKPGTPLSTRERTTMCQSYQATTLNATDPYSSAARTPSDRRRPSGTCRSPAASTSTITAGTNHTR
jgi:lysyl-tRNA synthetase class 2